MAQIRALLATDPQGALALTEEGNRRFAGGLMHEEREASAVRALMTLGRDEQARRAQEGLFGVENHDAGVLAKTFGPLPGAGFFCNGEIGPVGTANFLHGYTASAALLSDAD